MSKKIRLLLSGLILSLSICWGSQNVYAAQYKELPIKIDVPKDKEWSFKLNESINATCANTNNIKIVDSNGNEFKIKLELSRDNKVVKVIPVKDFKAGEKYTLMIKGLESKSGKDLKQDIKMSFTVKKDLKNGLEFDMEQILKDYRNNQKFVDSMFDLWESDYFPQDYQGWLNYKDNIFNVNMKKFQQKYFNEKYAPITDLDYYMKMPGVTIKFDKVNNANTFEPSHFAPGKYGDLEMSILGWASGYYGFPKEGGYSFDGHLKYHFIWRPDFEKEMIELINQRRVEKGLNALEIDLNLTAMAKWASKRCYSGGTFSSFGNGYDDMFYVEKENGKYKLFDYTNSEYKEWFYGITPFMYKKVEDKQFYVKKPKYFFDEYMIYKFGDLEKDVERLFGYKKKIYLLNDCCLLNYKPEQFLEYWEYKKIVGKTVYGKPEKEINIDKYLYNPNIKKIGVGCLYNAPFEPNNGLTGFNIIVSE